MLSPRKLRHSKATQPALEHCQQPVWRSWGLGRQPGSRTHTLPPMLLTASHRLTLSDFPLPVWFPVLLTDLPTVPEDSVTHAAKTATPPSLPLLPNPSGGLSLVLELFGLNRGHPSRLMISAPVKLCFSFTRSDLPWVGLLICKQWSQDNAFCVLHA